MKKSLFEKKNNTPIDLKQIFISVCLLPTDKRLPILKKNTNLTNLKFLSLSDYLFIKEMYFDKNQYIKSVF